jgi:pimeloyl-ACP methyl ester carboxylesterase
MNTEPTSSIAELVTAAGRRFSYAVYGAPESATVVVYLHGFPGSCIEGALADVAAKELGIKIIALDRPGVGNSEPAGIKSYPAAADLLRSFVEALGLSSFHLLATSGGAPFALACAARWGDRVLSTTIVSGMGPVAGQPLPSSMSPTNRKLLGLGVHAPWLARQSITLIARWIQRRPHHMIPYLRRILPLADRAILRRSAVIETLERNTAQALHQGSSALLQEFTLLTRPWSIDYSTIKGPVHFWHGDGDAYVPFDLIRTVIPAIKQSRTSIVPGGGHFMVVDIVERVLSQIGSEL